MKKITALLTVIAMLLPGVVRAEVSYKEIYVDPTYSGSDTNVYNTLKSANDAAKKLAATTPVRVNIKSGTYYLTETFKPVSSSNKIAYRGVGDDVKFIGAKKVKKANITAADASLEPRLNASATQNIKRIDLKAENLTNYGTIPHRGYEDNADKVFEMRVFTGEKSYKNARWPNVGYAISGYVPSYDPKDNSVPVEMECLEGRQLSWTLETNGFIEAFNNYEYRSASSQIYGISEETGRMLLSVPGDTVSTFERSKRYYAYNILEELDAPGEFYVDRTNGYLYFYQYEDEGADVYVSTLQSPVITVSGLRDVSFENINICYSGNNGILVENSKNISFKNCDITNVGGSGVIIKESSHVSFADAEITECGSHAIDISVAIPEDLSGCNITFSGNTVAGCSRKSATSVGAITMSGVGITLSDNVIHDMPHQAIQFFGLKHLIKDNEVYDVCKEVRDAGAIYIGRSWSWRGNRITGNYIHDLTGYYGNDVTGVYLDDYMSGVRIDNNIFRNCQTAISASGGRDNIITDNLIYNCRSSIGCTTHWGIDNDEWYSKEGTNASKNLYLKLKNTTYLEKLLEDYPEVEYLYNDDEYPQYPKNNVIKNNIIYNSPDVKYDDNVKQYGDISTTGVKYTVLYK